MSANANKVRTTRRGDTEYTYTDHFDVYRDVSAEFKRIPADASEKMPDEQMDMLEPYNYSEITDLQCHTYLVIFQKNIIIQLMKYRVVPRREQIHT